MSRSEAEKLRARQDKLARAEARKAKMARQEAREAEATAALRAEQERLVAEARAARAAGRMPATGKAKRAPAALPGNRPVLGTRTVPDPLEPGAQLTATVNLAEHPLEMMLARRRLTQAQYEAGVRYRAIYEKASIGAGGGIDPGKIKVDGGKLVDPLSDEVLHAQFELKRLAKLLGPIGAKVVRSVAGEGLTVAELSERWPTPDSRSNKLAYIGMRLRDELETLAERVWGARGPEYDKPRIVAEIGLGSEDYDEQALASANQRFMRRQGIAGLVVNRDA